MKNIYFTPAPYNGILLKYMLNNICKSLTFNQICIKHI